MRAGPTTLKNPEKQTFGKPQLEHPYNSHQNTAHRGGKTPRCISRRCVACLLRPFGHPCLEDFQGDFSLENGRDKHRHDRD